MLACIRCGLCLTSCPTYVLSLHESEGPRGRVGIARALAEGHLQITPDLVEHELNCLVCDACSAVCPAGVHMDPLQVVLRETLEVTQAARRPPRERLLRALVFGWLFMDMRRFRAVARLMWLYQRSGARWLARKLGILKVLKLADAEALLPDMPAEFFVPRGESCGEGTDAAALFAGCVMSTALAEVDRATLRVLQRAGLRVESPVGQGCCGALHGHSGDPRFRELARRNIAAFERTEGPIVVNSAGCGAMLKDYAHHFRADPVWAERARAFSARVRDVSQVLCDRDLAGGTVEPTSVVYQDACHLLHAQRISREPRELLRRIQGVDLKEIAEPGLCCGSAGVYNVTNPVQANALQRRKLDHALAPSPDVIVTGNPGCLLQLRAGLGERHSSVRVMHLVELLDQASAR
ncbi:MAG: (Fe-S)-binding protein [Chloroflexi bacterium]|nr:(Fe-S)-binding protein [Chloroflexota bacterium]